MESRMLLSGTPATSPYFINTLDYFGANATGGNPRSTLVADAKGNLYGTTSAGGTYGAGTVFEIAKGSTTLTTLYSFNGVHGTSPYGGLAIDDNGNLFGTTYQGGASDFGTVFEIAAGPVPNITTLVSFSGPDGEHPTAGVTLDANGNLYGTAADGGDATSDGTVWEYVPVNNTLTVLALFNKASGGAVRPTGNVALDSSGDVYGTTQYGGTATDANNHTTYPNHGTVFEVPANSNQVTTLASFTGTNGIGIGPMGGVTRDTSGNLYGTTAAGGDNQDGTVFELGAGSNQITTLASFKGTDGAAPYAAVTVDPSGTVFGTTLRGGASGAGTVFEVVSGTQTITPVASFDNADGASPYGGVYLDAQGNIFGTADLGGDNGAGTVYEILNGSKTVTTLLSFEPTGASLAPYNEGVIVDKSGNVFGMTPNGGAFGQGSVYEIAADTATFTTIASFTGSTQGDPSAGAQPQGVLALDAKGNLFGATTLGGLTGYGTVFKIAKGSNAITTLASFDAATTGANPAAGVVIDSAGNLFGTTPNGGANGDGTVFELATGSTAIASLASFDPTQNGYSPYTGVTLDAAGNLFGTAQGIDNSATPGGANSSGGIVYEIASGSNTITPLASFSYDNGQYLNGENPDGGVVVDSSGNLYGTAAQGGANGAGTIFELASGAHTILALFSFDADNNGNVTGANPYGGLTLDSNNNLYGTTYQGGAADDGTVFELTTSHALSVLANFTGRDGAFPESAMAMDSAGNFYGTTEQGGVIGAGTVFELSSTKSVVTLAPDAAPNPAPGTDPLGYTVRVADDVPDGQTVTIEDTSNGNVVVASGTLDTDTAVLTIPANTLAAGTHQLVAVYAGDGTFPPGQSLPYTQFIGAAGGVPALVGSPVINGDDPNGLYSAAGQSSPGQQRSMVEDIVYTFNEPVTITNANQAFTVLAVGAHPGAVPTTLYAQAVSGSNGTQWAVSLTGQPEGTIGSIANGEYSITINPAYVFAAADGVTPMAPGTGRTDKFYRLYGDVFGTENITALDYNKFKASLTTYNPMFDNYNTGNITALDYNLFKKDLVVNYSGDGFVTSI